MSSPDAALSRIGKRGYNCILGVGVRGLAPEPVSPQYDNLCGLALTQTRY